MRELATGITPSILRWAREQSGYTLEQVAKRIGKTEIQISAWERGTAHPTWRQLEHLAHDVYRRPTAIFFFPGPPDEQPLAAEFRRLPEAALLDLEPDTWYAVRQAKVRQLDLAELAQFQDDSKDNILAALGGSARVNASNTLASQARAYIGVPLSEQVSWRNDTDALNRWRDAVQDCGVWVFKRSFRQKDVAGFSLASSHYPLVYLNNGQAKTRQIFTLFHELGHLLFGTGHLVRTDPERNVRFLQGENRAIEIACNAFAGEFLIPDDDFRLHASPSLPDDETVQALASRYSVSREVILRDYRDRGWIDQSYYNAKVAELRQNYAGASGSGWVDPVSSRGTYLGAKFTELAFRGYYQGTFDIDQLSDFLGVKTSNVLGLESWLHRRLRALQ